ncbi:penicillin-binding protein 2 [Candidatus Kaiserbacteria bacterium]|nr:penicillin-binding protein 2 [Candidatus Kaiserbacteria bacterium]
MTTSHRSRSAIKIRARILSAFFIAFALLLITRLYFVQIVHQEDYRKNAMGQYVESNPDSIDRGSIYFTTRNKEIISAAIMQSGWRVAIQPPTITDAAAAYTAINTITPIDHDRFMQSATKKDDPYEEVAFQLDDATAKSVRAQNIPGVILVHDQWRFYPAKALAANVLGFVGYSGGTSKSGLYGLENFYQDTLAHSSSNTSMNPFAEIFTSAQTLISRDPAAHQGSIVTSIEPNVQHQLEDTLDGVMNTYGSKSAGGIVMDPHTGEVVAMAVRPSFDPNTYNLESSVAVFSNGMVSGRYELGSIMKPITMAIGLDSDAITPETTYNDRGCITVSTYKVCNFDQKARGVIPMQEILNQSLNVGASFVADKTGYPTFTRYMRLFGFGDKTGIDLPGEVTGDLSPLGNGHESDVNYDTASFGQGISVSPIEMTRALSALANGGVLPNPHIVTAVKYDSGITRTIDVPPGVQVIKPHTASTVTNMLIKVFDNELLHGELKQEHYSIAAKTGTAQIPKPGGGYYPAGTYLHSFFGYFPAHDPRFIVFLFTIEPHGQQYASATLARPFMSVAQYLINYYNIPPDR